MEIEYMNVQGKNIPWLPDDDFKKSLFQLRGQLMELMRPLELYGQKPIVDDIIAQVIDLTVDFSLKARGIDRPLLVNPRWSDKDFR